MDDLERKSTPWLNGGFDMEGIAVALAVLLLIGGVVGAQIGTRIGVKMKAEQLRILLAVLVLGVSIKLAMDLLLQPSELYSLGAGGH